MQRGGIKAIFAFFFPLLCCVSLELCVEFMLVTGSGKITLLTPTLLSPMVCVPVIDAGWRLGDVWQEVVLFWDPAGLGFPHTGNHPVAFCSFLPKLLSDLIPCLLSQ